MNAKLTFFCVLLLVTVVQCFLTTFHDATVSQENTPQNVWGGDDYALGCMGEAAYALIPKSSALTTGMLVSGFGFKNETALQANSRILKVDVRLWAFAGADRRTSTTKFHIGLESVVVRSGGLDIYSQLFGGEPRLLSATPIQLDVSLEKIQSIGSMLFRGDQALSEQFGIVTYWRNHDSTSNWHVNLDCVQARLMFENDAPPTPQPPPRPTTNGPILTTPSPTTTTTPLTTTTHAATGGDDTNATSVASLFTFQDHASDTALALSTETVIAIVVPVAAACVLCITVGVICILRRRANDRKPSASTPAAKDKVERRKETLRVQNNAFEGTPLASPPDTAAAPEPAAPPAESPRPVQPQPVTTTVVAKSVALPTQPEKPSHIVIASYPALRAQPAATALAAPANTAGAPAGVIFVERGYEVPYSFDSDSQQVYMGQHGVAANFTPAVGHEAHANMLLDRHVRDQYASPAKQNQVLDDIF